MVQALNFHMQDIHSTHENEKETTRGEEEQKKLQQRTIRQQRVHAEEKNRVKSCSVLH